jgi:hypothetical protein
MPGESHATAPAVVIYRPVGWMCSVVAGLVGVAVKRVWGRISPGEHEKKAQRSAVGVPRRLADVTQFRL